jgi:large subunit ribosomal protein L25
LENVIISLKVKNKTRPCLIKEIQYHPVHGDITHVDFNEISLTKAVKINIPVVAKGEPVGVKQEGGSLEHILWEVEVECLPTDIPKEIEVDVSQLKIGDSIHVKELPVPPKVKILSDPDATVISVAEPLKEEVAAAPVEGEVAQEPEVIKEKKEAPAEGETPAEEKGKKEK